ncbi:MAG: glycosyltransferase family 4 protein [Flavobacteriaceae bacterium]|nr:glycosyltransferase family 4 protein [Flavobacteriaceae bacterium]
MIQKYKNITKSKEIRVIIVIPGKKEGISMIFSKNLVEYLREEGVTVREFYLPSRTNPFILLKEFIRLKKEIKNFQPNIIHSNYGTMTSFFSAKGSFIHRIPLVITFRGSDLNNTTKIDGFFRNLFGRILSQLSALRASKIICVSKKLQEKLWWRKDIAEIIPSPGVNLELFTPIDKEKARSILGWDNNKKVVLFNAKSFLF